MAMNQIESPTSGKKMLNSTHDANSTNKRRSDKKTFRKSKSFGAQPQSPKASKGKDTSRLDEKISKHSPTRANETPNKPKKARRTRSIGEATGETDGKEAKGMLDNRYASVAPRLA